MALSASTKEKNWLAALRRVWAYHYFGEDPTSITNVPITLNAGTFPGQYATGDSADNQYGIPMIGVDGNNQVVFPVMRTVTYNEALNASIGTTEFFIADQAYTVLGVSYVNKTAGTVAGATVTVTKDSATAAPGTGSPLLTAPISCLAVANTVSTGTLIPNNTALTLAAGDRLSVLFSGTLTTLAGVVVTVQLLPSVGVEGASAFWRVNGDMATTSFFTANRDVVVTGVKAIYGTAFAAGVTINVTHDTGAAAAGSGASVLAAAMAGDGPINTVITPPLAALASTLSLAAGERLAVKFSATTTGALLCISVTFQPLSARKEVTFQLAPNAQQQVAQCFFIADRNYEIIDGSCIADVAAGGAANLAITIDKGAALPGAGNVTQTDNANAGFDLNAAPRVVQYMTPASLHLRLMSPGDRLGLKVTGAAGTLADVEITASLRPV